MVIYIFGDNGSSAEGQRGSISELLAQNGIPTTVDDQLAALDAAGRPGGAGFAEDRQHVPRRLGVGRQYAVSPHQAGGQPFRWYPQSDGDLLAAAGSPPDGVVRGQFHHVNDITPTIYEVLGITAPEIVDGHEQKPLDGISLAYTFDHA